MFNKKFLSQNIYYNLLNEYSAHFQTVFKKLKVKVLIPMPVVKQKKVNTEKSVQKLYINHSRSDFSKYSQLFSSSSFY